MVIKNIAVIGTGGVGGYFGAKLCQLQKSSGANGCRVSFVARGEHLRAIKENGLHVSTEQDGDIVCQPFLATDQIESLPPPDLCLLCIKVFDLPQVLSRLAPLIGEQSIVLPLLNGVDIPARIRNVVKTGVVLPACVYIGTHIDRPGHVVQKGGACTILYGPDPTRPSVSLDDFERVFKLASIRSEKSATIEAEIWTKFIFICGFGLVCAARAKSLGQILDDGQLRQETRTIMQEIISVAELAGIQLPSDLAESTLAKGRNFPPQTKTSFQRDFERSDKADERDLFAGTILRMADRLGVDITQSRALAAMLNAIKPAAIGS